MSTQQSARLDLYNGLIELLGPERAEALMSYLPVIEPSEVLTKSDLLAFGVEIGGRFDLLEERIDRLEERMDRLEKRMDRMINVLMAGLFMVVAALIGVVAPLVWWAIR